MKNFFIITITFLSCTVSAQVGIPLPERKSNFDVLNIDINLELDVKGKFLSGIVTSEITPTVNDLEIIELDADLAVDFIEKEIKDKQMSYKVENSETGGKGLIVYNLTKGCVVKKETSTNLKLDMKISAGSQSVNTTQDVTTELFVNLIQ